MNPVHRRFVVATLAGLLGLGLLVGRPSPPPGAAGFERRYAAQLRALDEWADDNVRYRADGAAWGAWLTSHAALFESTNIIAAAVREPGDETLLEAKVPTLSGFGFPDTPAPAEGRGGVVQPGERRYGRGTLHALRYQRLRRDRAGRRLLVEMVAVR